MIKSGDGDQGVADCPYAFYAKWIADPKGAREQVESFTRDTIGTDESPIEGLPNKTTSSAKVRPFVRKPTPVTAPAARRRRAR